MDLITEKMSCINLVPFVPSHILDHNLKSFKKRSFEKFIQISFKIKYHYIPKNIYFSLSSTKFYEICLTYHLNLN